MENFSSEGIDQKHSFMFDKSGFDCNMFSDPLGNIYAVNIGTIISLCLNFLSSPFTQKYIYTHT